MNIGDRINTDLGEVIILDIQKKYLILFSEEKEQFVKANGYDKNLNNKYFWQGGEYYNTFTELIKNLKI